MLAPSFSCRPTLLVSEARSLPARSTSDSLPVYTCSSREVVTGGGSLLGEAGKRRAAGVAVGRGQRGGEGGGMRMNGIKINSDSSSAQTCSSRGLVRGGGAVRVGLVTTELKRGRKGGRGRGVGDG